MNTYFITVLFLFSTAFCFQLPPRSTIILCYKPSPLTSQTDNLLFIKSLQQQLGQHYTLVTPPAEALNSISSFHDSLISHRGPSHSFLLDYGAQYIVYLDYVYFGVQGLGLAIFNRRTAAPMVPKVYKYGHLYQAAVKAYVYSAATGTLVSQIPERRTIKNWNDDCDDCKKKIARKIAQRLTYRLIHGYYPLLKDQSVDLAAGSGVVFPDFRSSSSYIPDIGALYSAHIQYTYLDIIGAEANLNFVSLSAPFDFKYCPHSIYIPTISLIALLGKKFRYGNFIQIYPHVGIGYSWEKLMERWDQEVFNNLIVFKIRSGYVFKIGVSFWPISFPLVIEPYLVVFSTIAAHQASYEYSPYPDISQNHPEFIPYIPRNDYEAVQIGLKIGYSYRP